MEMIMIVWWILWISQTVGGTVTIKSEDPVCKEYSERLKHSWEIMRETEHSTYALLNAGIDVVETFRNGFLHCVDIDDDSKMRIVEALSKYGGFPQLVAEAFESIKKNRAAVTRSFIKLIRTLKEGDTDSIASWINGVLHTLPTSFEGRPTRKPTAETNIKIKLFVFNFFIYSGVFPSSANGTCIALFENMVTEFADFVANLWNLHDPWIMFSHFYRGCEELYKVLNGCPDTAQHILGYVHKNWRGTENVANNVQEKAVVLASNAYNLETAVREARWEQIGAWSGLFLQNLLFSPPFEIGADNQRGQNSTAEHLDL